MAQELSTRPFALITGGTSGIGLGIAKALLADYDLALVYGRDTERAKVAKDYLLSQAPIESKNPRSELQIEIFQQDLCQIEQLPALYSSVVERFRKAPAVLVNSAGRIRDGLFQSSEMSEHQELIHEHLLATMAFCKLSLKSMSQAKFGRIINISSISAMYAKRGQANYAAAKAGIEAFTRTLALEVAHRGVTVNAIAPGLIETEMTKPLIEKMEADPDGIRKRIPAGRAGTTEEVGSLAAFLCCAQAAYITGTTITIDGGRSLGDPTS